jgi:hypothetical protein
LKLWNATRITLERDAHHVGTRRALAVNVARVNWQLGGLHLARPQSPQGLKTGSKGLGSNSRRALAPGVLVAHEKEVASGARYFWASRPL